MRFLSFCTVCLVLCMHCFCYAAVYKIGPRSFKYIYEDGRTEHFDVSGIDGFISSMQVLSEPLSGRIRFLVGTDENDLFLLSGEAGEGDGSKGKGEGLGGGVVESLGYDETENGVADGSKSELVDVCENKQEGGQEVREVGAELKMTEGKEESHRLEKSCEFQSAFELANVLGNCGCCSGGAIGLPSSVGGTLFIPISPVSPAAAFPWFVSQFTAQKVSVVAGESDPFQIALSYASVEGTNADFPRLFFVVEKMKF